MIGVVELLARDAWLRMNQGPLAGKEFLVFKDTMRMGSSPRSDIYLFNDSQVADQHAVLRATGDAYELENLSQHAPVTVNGRPISRSRLRHGDQIGLGSTLFTFNCKRRD
jgi:pSer/pThr/pTyr-binding forkhead associated (FHA) protein